MKRTVLMICVIVACCFGLQNSFGQNALEINQAAAENTAALKKQIKFNTEQEHQVYQSFKVYQRQLAHIESMSGQNNIDVAAEKKKIFAELSTSLKGILTAEQYDLFLANEEQQ